MKNKLDNRGSVPLTILVGMLAMIGLIMSIMMATNEKYSNIKMGERITSRYLGESSLDIQKYLIHNKLDNKTFKIYFYEKSEEETGEELVRVYFKGGNLFEQDEIKDGEIQDITVATNMILEEHGKYGSIKDITTSVKLQSPDNAQDTEIRYMCKDASFLLERVNDSIDNTRCVLDNFTLSSDVKYKGGKISTTYEISNVAIIREPFFGALVSEEMIDGELYKIGFVEARLDTENLKIITKTFQNYRSGD